ncbi:MauE/DoxX family redox-associated membrane protein [Exiguobacterium acetylicum]|uniref:MauE/DoxX family redox-associated membrane protein n=1 Tax=Exiguobacterium acetylicum TaxID=41170 RepID=UPI0039778495
MEFLITLVSITIGYMFLTSAISKMRTFDQHKKIIHSYDILPSKTVHYFAYIDVAFELFLAAMLLSILNLPIVSILSIALLLLYTIAISINLIRGKVDLDCGCGGIVGENKISWKLVIRNMFISLILVFLYVSSNNFTTDWSIVFLIVHLVLIQTILLILANQRIVKFKKHYEKLGGNYE